MIQPFKGTPKYELDDLVLSKLNFGKIKISNNWSSKRNNYTGATKEKN